MKNLWIGYNFLCSEQHRSNVESTSAILQPEDGDRYIPQFEIDFKLWSAFESKLQRNLGMKHHVRRNAKYSYI